VQYRVDVLRNFAAWPDGQQGNGHAVQRRHTVKIMTAAMGAAPTSMVAGIRLLSRVRLRRVRLGRVRPLLLRHRIPGRKGC
jgi:hypothetical protein